jgi:hypothetical protein
VHILKISTYLPIRIFSGVWEQAVSSHNSPVPFEIQEQRRSDRAIPFISDEETVLIVLDVRRPLISKMLDLSEGGTLVYLVEGPDAGFGENPVCRLMLYHQGEVFAVDSKVARLSGKLIGFEFIDPPLAVVNRIQAKLIQMEVAWMRVQRQNRDLSPNT